MEVLLQNTSSLKKGFAWGRHFEDNALRFGVEDYL